MLSRPWLPLGLLAVCLLALAGCGAKEAAKSTVNGRVSYRGEPLHGGLIVFVPDEERGSHGPLFKAAIQPDGAFALDADAPAGWYRVAVAPLPSAVVSVPTASDPYPTVPARYRNPNLSGLRSEVKPGCDNVFEFQLDDAIAARGSGEP